MINTTHTYVVLPVSHAAYVEIKSKLETAGYQHAFHEDREGGIVIDMHGIAISDSGEGKSAMQPHQQRVVQEKEELTEKVDKLAIFIDGAVYASLPAAE